MPVSAILSSASMHDSLAAVPLSRISAKRIDSLYDLMDAAYCSLDLHEHCRELGHVPIIDHNPHKVSKRNLTSMMLFATVSAVVLSEPMQD